MRHSAFEEILVRDEESILSSEERAQLREHIAVCPACSDAAPLSPHEREALASLYERTPAIDIREPVLARVAAGRGRGGSMGWRRFPLPVRMGLVAMPVGLGVAAVLVALFGPWGREGLSPGAAVAEAYNRLLVAKSLRYIHEGQAGGSVCQGRIGVELTDEDRGIAGLPPEVKYGNVVQCRPSPWSFVAEGEFDLARKAYHTRTRRSPPEGIPSVGWDSERSDLESIYVDGHLYSKRGDEGWQLVSSQAPWDPFSAPRGWSPDPYGGIPPPGMEALKGDFEGYDRLADEAIVGVPVEHYRKLSTFAGSPDEGTPERRQLVEVWVDKARRLPLKVLIETRSDFSGAAYGRLRTQDGKESSFLEMLVQDMRTKAPPGWRDAPVVVRPSPNETVLRSVFTFSGFDEPVRIETPIIETGTQPGSR
ncbi:MAG: zf-HC2 domain-containing protein [Chloroflexota bacterium]|nr:zf-HC2 domain-containing protein [Chloroflexota bacterium]